MVGYEDGNIQLQGRHMLLVFRQKLDRSHEREEIAQLIIKNLLLPKIAMFMQSTMSLQCHLHELFILSERHNYDCESTRWHCYSSENMKCFPKNPVT